MHANKSNSLQIPNAARPVILLPAPAITEQSIDIPDVEGATKSFTNTTGALVQIIADSILDFTRNGVTIDLTPFTGSLQTIVLSQGDKVTLTNPSNAIAIPLWATK